MATDKFSTDKGHRNLYWGGHWWPSLEQFQGKGGDESTVMAGSIEDGRRILEKKVDRSFKDISSQGWRRQWHPTPVL